MCAKPKMMETLNNNNINTPKQAPNVNIKISLEEMFDRASNGDLSILNNENVSIYRNDKNDRDQTPLHCLAALGHIEVLSHPAVDKVFDNQGFTPLHFIAYRKAADDDNNEVALIKIMEHKSLTTVKNKVGDTPLHTLALAECALILKHKDVAIVRNNNGDTPLHILALTGNEVVLTHSDIGLVKNYRGNIPLHYLIIQKQNPIKSNNSLIDKILNHKDVTALIDEKSGCTALHLIASYGIKEVLFHKECDIVKDVDGFTPRHYYSYSNLKNVITHNKL